MKTAFRKRIIKSLADSNLQAALDANAEKRITVRQAAFSSLPDAQEARFRAHVIRKDVIENLDRYLDQFTSQLSQNGIQVHRAEDAEQAIKIVSEIAKRNQVKLIAKSKTMVSEEIELNHALQRTGFRVVETDLGEYIVQIRNEVPSHIITPAVHLRRADVGKTFHDVLGIPYTEDVPTMTAAARANLREVFLHADMGISGVNFGIAQSGTLCVVTNEGNGRMVTTLPPIHVALMGIERLLPTLDDLALMLSLLPRSATGQKLSVYTNLINAPCRSGDPDGAHERHVILLDNGRSKIRHTVLAEILYCIRCGACLNACPVFREIGGHAYVGVSGKHSVYPGPIGSVLAPALFGQSEFGHLARASSLCGACKEACPVDIDLPKLLLRIRAGYGENNTRRTSVLGNSQDIHRFHPNTPSILKIGLRFFTWAATSSTRFSVAQWLTGVAGRVGYIFMPLMRSKDSFWLRLPTFTGWGMSKDFPIPAKKSFSKTWKQKHSQIIPVTNVNKHPDDFAICPAKISEGNRIEIFRNELTSLGGSLDICDEKDVISKIADILSSHQATSLLTWHDSQLPHGILDKLKLRGIEVIYPADANIEDINDVRVGLTGAIAGIAETGSLLITSGEGRPLTASLLPQVHISILREENLYPDLKSVLNLPNVYQSSTAVLISGPSRTADIEMTLTIGVHGPGEVHVIMVKQDSHAIKKAR